MAKQKDELSSYMKCHEMGEAVEAGTIKINWGGHYASGTKGEKPKCYDPSYVTKKVGSALRMTLADADVDALYEAWKSGVTLGRFIDIGPDYIEDCWECGEEITLESDGVTWRAKHKCQHPTGLPAIEFELNVPSGKLVVANDLRDLFLVLGHHNVNQPIGCYRTTMDYAKIGLAHGNVGNSCPGVYECRGRRKSAGTHFVIGTTSNKNKNPRFNQDDKATRVAGISTDLWWYSICDADEFAKRAGKSLEEAAKDYDADIVPCVPGVYKFRHIYHLIREKRDDFKQAHVYTYIKRVRNPEPVKDYMGAYNDLNLTAEQVICEKVRKWPTLYAEQYSFTDNKKVTLPLDHQYARAADSLMMTIGTGDEYHPNGFWGGEPGMTNASPAVEPVVLDKPYNWYPGSENYSTLSHIAGLSERVKVDLKVNDSFIALAFNVCRCILTHGVQDYHKETESHSKSTFAKKCMKALKKRYPDKIPPNCVDIKETTTPYVFKELR